VKAFKVFPSGQPESSGPLPPLKEKHCTSPCWGAAVSHTDLTVLVVDDYPDVAETVADLLTSAGFRAHAALSSGAALELAEEVEPDVVVLEPMMHDGGGWEVARWLRRRDGSGPALIALTYGTCTVADCRERGFDYMVLKGDDPKTLLAAVALCVRSEP
jgi:two-component system, OmpR family, response regulator